VVYHKYLQNFLGLQTVPSDVINVNHLARDAWEKHKRKLKKKTGPKISSSIIIVIPFQSVVFLIISASTIFSPLSLDNHRTENKSFAYIYYFTFARYYIYVIHRLRMNVFRTSQCRIIVTMIILWITENVVRDANQILLFSRFIRDADEMTSSDTYMEMCVVFGGKFLYEFIRCLYFKSVKINLRFSLYLCIHSISLCRIIIYYIIQTTAVYGKSIYI